MFDNNPCRWNALEIFQIDRSTMERKVLNERINRTKEDWKFEGQKVRMRNGEMQALDEARLNDFQKRIDNPVLRLREEQLVHQVHSFTGNEEMLNAVKELQASQCTTAPPSVAGTALIGVIGALLPSIPSHPMQDDLPWPEPLPPFRVEEEPLADAVLRDN